LALLQGGAGAQGGVQRDAGEADGGHGRAEDEPGGGETLGSFHGSGVGRWGLIWRQVGERDGQFVPGAGGQDLPGSLVVLAGRDPARLQSLAQLGQRPVALGVRYPDLAWRKVAPASCVHDWCSFGV
jgi:hypothetical protein